MSHGTMNAGILPIVGITELQAALDGRFGQASALGDVTDGHALFPKRPERVEIVARLDRVNGPLLSNQTRLERLRIGPVKTAGLFKVNLETGTLLRQVVRRPA